MATTRKSTKVEKNGTDRTVADSPAPERRATLLRSLRKAGAKAPKTAMSMDTLCEKTGYSRFDVYGLVNGTSGKVGSAPSCLVATGHVKTVKHPKSEGGLHVFLTRKGETDLAE